MIGGKLEEGKISDNFYRLSRELRFRYHIYEHLLSLMSHYLIINYKFIKELRLKRTLKNDMVYLLIIICWNMTVKDCKLGALWSRIWLRTEKRIYTSYIYSQNIFRSITCLVLIKSFRYLWDRKLKFYLFNKIS